MVPSERSPTNWGLATDHWKLLFELVGDRSVTVPKPFSNQLLQLQEESPWCNRQVADHLKVKTQWKLSEPYAFLSLRARRVVAAYVRLRLYWTFNSFLCSTMQSNEYCASFLSRQLFSCLVYCYRPVISLPSQYNFIHHQADNLRKIRHRKTIPLQNGYDIKIETVITYFY